MCLAGSHEFSALGRSFHLTKYWSCLFLILESNISSTSISSSESTIIGSGTVGVLPGIVSLGALVSRDMWNMSCTPFSIISLGSSNW